MAILIIFHNKLPKNHSKNHLYEKFILGKMTCKINVKYHLWFLLVCFDPMGPWPLILERSDPILHPKCEPKQSSLIRSKVWQYY
jgi:hypothetical protein